MSRCPLPNSNICKYQSRVRLVVNNVPWEQIWYCMFASVIKNFETCDRHTAILKTYKSCWLFISQVFKIKVEGDSFQEVIEVFLDNGKEVMASTVAYGYKGRLIVGSLGGNPLLCDLQYVGWGKRKPQVNMTKIMSSMWSVVILEGNVNLKSTWLKSCLPCDL